MPNMKKMTELVRYRDESYNRLICFLLLIHFLFSCAIIIKGNMFHNLYEFFIIRFKMRVLVHEKTLIEG